MSAPYSRRPNERPRASGRMLTLTRMMNMTNDKYKMVQDLADGWREKYEDAKQQLAKAHRLIDELETKRDIAVSTLEKVKVDRATAQKALAATEPKP